MGAKTIRAEIVASAISRRWQSCVPIQGIRMMLKARAPKIPPTVLAAYTLPTRVPESSLRAAAAASAKGKLAPHRQAAGKTAHMQRMMST